MADQPDSAEYEMPRVAKSSRLGRLAREALKNLETGRAGTVLLVLAAAAAVAIAATAEARSAESARHDFEDFRARGGYLFAVDPVSEDPAGRPQPLSQRACERLNGVPGVTAAGATGTVTEVEAANLGATIEVTGVTPGMYAAIGSVGHGPEPDPAHLLADEIGFERLGLESGRTLGLGGHGRRRVLEAPLGTVSPGFVGAVIGAEAPIGTGDVCIVALEPNALNLASALRAAFGRSDTALRRVLPGADLVASPFEEHRSRLSRHAWWAVAVAFGAIGRFVVWTRRSEVALYRSLGLPPDDIRLMIAIEMAVGAGAGAVVGAAAARLLAIGYHPDSILHGWLGTGLATAVLVVACAAVAATTSTGHPLANLKDR